MVLSQNKWPALPEGHASLVTIEIVGRLGTRRFVVAREAANVLHNFLTWFDANIEPIRSDSGGYNYRLIRGSSETMSNHSSGTAVDINWEKHPLGAQGTFTSAQATAIRAKAKSLGLRWGGDYRNRKDEMHIEVDYPPEDASIWDKASFYAGRAIEDVVTTADEGSGGSISNVENQIATLTRKASQIPISYYVISGLLISAAAAGAIFAVRKKRKSKKRRR